MPAIALAGLLTAVFTALGLLATALFRLDAKIDNRFDALVARLDRFETRVEARFDHVDARLDHVEHQLAVHTH